MMTNTPMLHETAPPPAAHALCRAGKLLAAAVMALAPVTAAHAQAVGGGGGTILNSAVTYFQNNIAADLGTLAVICIGIFLLAALDSISKALRP